MDKDLQTLNDFIQQDPNMPAEQKESVLKSLKAVDKELQILSFKLDRTEKVKRTTAILLEETIEELEQKRKAVEEALTKLKATQEQLIQQEKLASLGQLTAGIAHEIKNPLNFVNNFSELSVELIAEVRDEIRELNAKFKTKNLSLIGLLDDIEMNLRKIYEHGSRADSIVKSMLEHSREGTGIMEPTEFNSLINEFVNLTFHGMRAGKDPIDVDIVYELDENITAAPLIAEDFSRVIVNLCSNAFEAMREKGIENSEFKIQNYSPKLSVRTKLEGDKITLEIEDNGSGIPGEIKNKILQPFFTTKKGTQGTGLGLSITNDIIKAHGGELRIKTEEGNGSVFIISLPAKTGNNGLKDNKKN